jgi:CheY-like chemotaxis protein
MKKFDCIVIIDDDQTFTYLQSIMFTDLNLTHRLEIFHDAQNALSFIDGYSKEHHKNPEIIFFDLFLMEMDGFEFIERYKRAYPDSCTASLLIAITNSLNPQDFQKIGQAGADGYLSKPLSESSILELIKQHFKVE